MTTIIGLTGGIASGKSTVANLLREKGVVVVDADVLARDAVAKGSAGLAEIVSQFGEDILTADGDLDRAKMGTLVFGDDDARQALNHIVHPEVARLFGEHLMAASERGDDWLVYEVPLLFENNLDAMMESTILVATDEARQIARMAERDGLNEADAKARIAAQMPLEEKRTRATWVINNTTSLEALMDQVNEVWAKATSRETDD